MDCTRARTTIRRWRGRGKPLSQTVAGLGGDLDAALGELRVAAAVADRDGIVRWQNERWTELAGDCVGRPLAEIVAPESTHEQRRQFSKKVLGTVRTTDYQMNMLAPDGSHMPIEVSAVVVEGTDHRIVGVFGTIQPVAPPLQAAAAPARSDAAPARGAAPSRARRVHRADRRRARHPARDRPQPVRGILRALRVHSRLEAVAAARQRGLLAD